jgi:hypothetical protein
MLNAIEKFNSGGVDLESATRSKLPQRMFNPFEKLISRRKGASPPSPLADNIFPRHGSAYG